MKLSTVVMGVGVGAFALVGCGGDGAGSLPEPTAKITEANATDVAEMAEIFTVTEPGNLIYNSSTSERLGKSISELGWYYHIPMEQGTFEGAEGTLEISFSKGKPISEGTEKADVSYTLKYNHFRSFTTDPVMQDGTVKIDQKFEETDAAETSEWHVTSSEFTYSGDNAKLTFTNFDKTGNWKETDEAEEKKVEVKYSATWEDHNKTYTFQNMDVKTESYESDVKETDTYEGRGAIDHPDYGGWLVFETTKKFVYEYSETTGDEKCTQGEMEIRGKEHTVTISCINGEEVVKFDGKEVASTE